MKNWVEWKIKYLILIVLKPDALLENRLERLRKELYER